MTYKIRWSAIPLAALLMILTACANVPITGRQQLNLIPNSQLASMGNLEYGKFLKEHQEIRGTLEARMVQRVGRRIQGAVEEYFYRRGQSAQLADYQWAFKLVRDDDSVNAFCLPGGKVAILTGILPVTRSETGLAVVMGHEIAHAIANHGGERVSQGLLVESGGRLLAASLENSSDGQRRAFLTAYGLGAQLGLMLPYSRMHEAEADRLGLIFMSMAGYDPRESVHFWQRMSANKKSKSAPPEFLSTHPADATRIANLNQSMPEALSYFQRPQR